jgi:hypothetical protein
MAAGVALSRKARKTVQNAPSGVAGNIGGAISELAGAIGTFGADVRAGMSEREEELSEVVRQRSGVSPLAGRALGVRDESWSRGARAGRADG